MPSVIMPQMNMQVPCYSCDCKFFFFSSDHFIILLRSLFLSAYFLASAFALNKHSNYVGTPFHMPYIILIGKHVCFLLWIYQFSSFSDIMLSPAERMPHRYYRSKLLKYHLIRESFLPTTFPFKLKSFSLFVITYFFCDLFNPLIITLDFMFPVQAGLTCHSSCIF